MTIKYHENSKEWKEKEITVLEVYAVLAWFICVIALCCALLITLIALAEHDVVGTLACTVYKTVGYIALAAIVFFCFRPLFKVLFRHCLNWEKYGKICNHTKSRENKQTYTIKERLGDCFEGLPLIVYVMVTVSSAIFGIWVCVALADNPTMAIKDAIMSQPLFLLLDAVISLVALGIQVFALIGALQCSNLVMLINDEGTLIVVTNSTCGGENE